MGQPLTRGRVRIRVNLDLPIRRIVRERQIAQRSRLRSSYPAWIDPSSLPNPYPRSLRNSCSLASRDLLLPSYER
jgi:hypothetical protein